ncbi:MAG: acyltransferase [Clostridia bacterium]|nr:acyltransferase [Clostridia bacterium]
MKKSNFTIDIFKFVFAVIIVLNHANVFLPYPLAIRGSLGVEFFFIVSGFLMARSVFTRERSLSVGESTRDFLKGKYLGIFPFFIVAIITSLAFCAIVNSWSAATIMNKSLYSIPELFWLQMFGFSGIHYPTGVAWYLSAMLIAMAFFYPLLLKFKKSVTYILAPIMVLFIYGTVWNRLGHLASPGQWLGFYYKGVLKGLAGIALGIICYDLALSLSKKVLTNWQRFALTIAEYTAWALAILLMFRLPKSSRLDFFLVALLFVAITICFSEQSYITQFLNRFNCPFFRKASVCIFLNNYYLAINMPKIISGADKQLPLYLVMVAVFSLFNYIIALFFIKLKQKRVS